MKIEYDDHIVETGAEVDPWPHDEETLCMHLFLGWRKFSCIAPLIGRAIAQYELDLQGHEANRFAEEFAFQLYSAFLQKKALVEQLSVYEKWSKLQQEAGRR